MAGQIYKRSRPRAEAASARRKPSPDARELKNAVIECMTALSKPRKFDYPNLTAPIS
jgi:hypothetical protein